MSAWSTNGRHNAILADALAAHGIISTTPDAVEAAYHQLAETNERSLHRCYGDDLTAMVAARLGYVPGGEVTLEAIVTLAESWIYQSCEHPGFDNEPATTLIRRLLQHLDTTHQISYQTLADHDIVWSIADLPASTHVLTFRFDHDRFNHWWDSNFDKSDSSIEARWLDNFNNSFEIIDGIINGDGSDSIVGEGDWEALAYRQYYDGHCDGLLLTARRRAWNASFQFATLHLDHSDLRDSFTDPDLTALPRLLVEILNTMLAAARRALAAEPI